MAVNGGRENSRYKHYKHAVQQYEVHDTSKLTYINLHEQYVNKCIANIIPLNFSKYSSMFHSRNSPSIALNERHKT